MSRRRSPRNPASNSVASDNASRTCSGCGQAVHEGTYLCSSCVNKTLAHALVNAAVFYSDLDTLRTKRTRYGGTTTRGSVGRTRPIGVDLRFVRPTRADYTSPHGIQLPGREGQGSELVHDVRNTVTTWVRVCLEEWPTLTWPRDNIPACCGFLLGIRVAIAGQPWAEELLRDMLRIERALSRMVDRPPERWYAGKCWVPAIDDEGNQAVCDQELYAQADSGTIRCRACGTQHDVAERREVLLEEAKDYLVTATEAAGALLAWTDYDGSESKLVDLICKWRDRDRLEVKDVTSLRGQDRHLYRLGDIQDLLVERAQRDQARRISA